MVLFLLMCIVWLGACGKEDAGGIGERLSGPEATSALPMRIDATVTPTGTRTPFEHESTPLPEESPTALPDLDDSATEKDELSELETRLNLLTPTPKELTGNTPTPPPAQDLEEVKVTATPTISISPSPSPTPEPTATPEPEPTKETTPQTEPTSTPVPPQESSDQNEKGTDKSAAESSPVVTSSGKQAKTTSPQALTRHVNDDITLEKLVVCSALSNRTPSGVSEQFSFSNVHKVYTWMKVSGATPPMKLKHRYYREGTFVTSVSLKIKYPSMRTWSQKSFKGPESQGKWKVVVTTEDERTILAEREFTLVP